MNSAWKGLQGYPTPQTDTDKYQGIFLKMEELTPQLLVLHIYMSRLGHPAPADDLAPLGHLQAQCWQEAWHIIFNLSPTLNKIFQSLFKMSKISQDHLTLLRLLYHIFSHNISVKIWQFYNPSLRACMSKTMGSMSKCADNTSTQAFSGGNCVNQVKGHKPAMIYTVKTVDFVTHLSPHKLCFWLIYLAPVENGGNFADNILKCNFPKENICNSNFT